MKVKITRLTVAQKRQVYPGDEIEVTKEEAIQLIGAGKAVAVKEAAVETAEMPAVNAESSEMPAVNTESLSGAVKRGKPKKASE